MASTIVSDGFYKKVRGLTPAHNALAQWIEEDDEAAFDDITGKSTQRPSAPTPARGLARPPVA